MIEGILARGVGFQPFVPLKVAKLPKHFSHEQICLSQKLWGRNMVKHSSFTRSKSFAKNVTKNVFQTSLAKKYLLQCTQEQRFFIKVPGKINFITNDTFHLLSVLCTKSDI